MRGRDRTGAGEATPPGSGPPGLEVAGATVVYGSTLALDDVTLSVPAGETLAVVGPSGSGKSTLLRAVAGLEPLTSGSVRAGGVDLAGLASHRRDIGLMFQDHALFPQLDVAGNVAFGLRMQRRSTAEQTRRVDELLDLVGLGPLRGRAVHELSGGEAQRVALARALAPEPRLILLDEPFGSLDRVLREQLTAELRRLLAELGQTAVHVTHDQDEAFALADRVAVLRQGRVEQVGRPDELWWRPDSSFVAAFLGHPNRWTVEHVDGRLSLAGVDLGPAVDEEPGAWPMVCPVGAVSVDPAGRLSGRVRAASFRRGRYVVEVVVGEPGGGVGGGEGAGSSPGRRSEPGPSPVPLVVTVEHGSPVAIGAEVGVEIEVAALHRLRD